MMASPMWAFLSVWNSFRCGRLLSMWTSPFDVDVTPEHRIRPFKNDGALPLSYNRIVRKQRNRLDSNQGNRSRAPQPRASHRGAQQL